MENQKRKRKTASHAALGKNKKQKVRTANGATATQNGNFVKKGTVMNADELLWSAIAPPDHMDDYEGFFGLEEIEGVDVVRDETSGKLSLCVADNSKVKTVAESKGTTSKKDSDQAPVVFDDSESDWNGFDDFGVDQGSSVDNDDDNHLDKGSPVLQIDDTNLLSQEDGNSSRKKAEKKKRSDQNHELTMNESAFSLLENEVQEDEVDVSAWQKLGVNPSILDSLAKLKFSRPTSIQAATIPEILDGRDLIGKAPTGSGKTLAFGIPILQTLLSRNFDRKNSAEPTKKVPCALVILPTRELAHQIEAHLTALFSNIDDLKASVATITGGLSVQKQRRILAQADVVVATPGRLWEIISEGQGTLELVQKIEFLVIDEADRLLSEGHFKELGEILSALDKKEYNEHDAQSTQMLSRPKGSQSAFKPSTTRQTLVFSATFAKSLQQKLSKQTKYRSENVSNKDSMEYLLQKLNFREEAPKFVDVNPVSQMASGLKEGLVECPSTEKDLYLYTVALLHSKVRTLVFVNSISAVRRLVPFLQNLDLPALPLHSQMAQKARLRSIERFSGTYKTSEKQTTSGKGSILVATDVAARGLDIPNVQLVIHYHLPRSADMYVHRSGRTARAEATGTSILISSPEEAAGVRRLVAQVHAGKLNSAKNAKSYFMRSVDIDTRIVSRLKPRAFLSKKLADAALAKEKKSSEDSFLRTAAEDLGVDYDSDEFEEQEKNGKGGKGAGRRRRDEQARGTTKAEMRAMRAELKEMLSKRVNVGVSEKYLSSGGVNVQELLDARERGEFLGSVGGLGLD